MWPPARGPHPQILPNSLQGPTAGGTPVGSLTHCIFILSLFSSHLKSSGKHHGARKTPEVWPLLAPFLNVTEGTVSPSTAFNWRLQSMNRGLCCYKGAQFLFLSFRLPGSAGQSKCDDAPLVFSVHDYKFLLRFPSETLQVRTISVRRVMKGGECTPGGVGGRGAGLRPGDPGSGELQPGP